MIAMLSVLSERVSEVHSKQKLKDKQPVVGPQVCALGSTGVETHALCTLDRHCANCATSTDFFRLTHNSYQPLDERVKYTALGG